MHWADEIAKKIVKNYPDRKKYVCAAGITPSGIIHIGNLRDVITGEFVVRALKDMGKDAELIWSWDDYDRFRKVPQNVPKNFKKYLGLPLCEVPDLLSCHGSYARHFEEELEDVLPRLGIKARLIYQCEQYKANRYLDLIKIALRRRKQIAAILSKYKARKTPKEEIEKYYPLSVYCSKCGKDTTRIRNYDGENLVSYRCDCGFEETADISKQNIGKPGWRVDWPMRWRFEEVVFEPGGRDHSSAGGSYDVCSSIAKEIFDFPPPIYQGYEWLGITGATHKMSGSTGEALSPKMLLEIYEPEIIRWFFARVRPEQRFDFALGDQIVRNYSEWDSFLLKARQGSLSESQERILFFSQADSKKAPEPGSVSFRQLASFAQIAKGNEAILKDMVEASGGEVSSKDLKGRLPRAIAWTEKYAPKQYRVALLSSPNMKYFATLAPEAKKMVGKLRDGLKGNRSLEDLTNLVYSIPKKDGLAPKETKVRQRDFFKTVYNLLLGADTGPRLPTFLLAIGQNKARRLLGF